MPVNDIDELIGNYELAEAKLIEILDDSCLEAEVHQADKELSLAFSALLHADLPVAEMRLRRIEFLLNKLTGEEEPDSLNSRLRQIILSDIAAITYRRTETAPNDFDGLGTS